jgi:MinD-like ATPase involved in chromosome partitioning or flagellar assembly
MLDFNLFNPDIDLHLGLSNKDLKYMLDFFLRNEINFENIDKYMFRYEKQKNLQVLTGLYDINFFDKFQLEHFSLFLEYLKKMGLDYIFIDVNSSLSIDATFVSVCTCDKLLIVGEPQYPCIRNINRYLDEALKKLGITEDKVELIINRYDPQLIDKNEINHIFGRDNITYINYSQIVKQSINKSEPFIYSNAKELRKSIVSLEQMIQRITSE